MEANSSNSPGRRNPSKCSRRSRYPGDKPPHNENGVSEENRESGKRERGVNVDSSFHFNAPENAVGKPKVPILLERGTPTVSVETADM
jgi:hypothetical protein